jgi:aspartyl-tRNA synthetase
VVALRVPGGGEMSRGEIDGYTEFVKIYGAKGLAWIKVNDAGKGRDGLQSPGRQEPARRGAGEIIARTGARNGDLIFFGADKAKVVNDAIGALRVKIGHSEFGRKHGLFEDKWAPLWVVDFPMFEYDDDGQALERRAPPVHGAQGRPRGLMTPTPAPAWPRPTTWCSTAGRSAAARCVSTAPTCRARCSRRSTSRPRSAVKFGFLLDALQYGAPPHGGLAFGLDRIATLMTGAESDPRRDRLPQDAARAVPADRAPSRWTRSSCANCTSGCATRRPAPRLDRAFGVPKLPRICFLFDSWLG